MTAQPFISCTRAESRQSNTRQVYGKWFIRNIRLSCDTTSLYHHHSHSSSSTAQASNPSFRASASPHLPLANLSKMLTRATTRSHLTTKEFVAGCNRYSKSLPVEDAELSPFVCGIGQCLERYKDNNWLRHHRQNYDHSEDSHLENGQKTVQSHT